MDVGKAPSRLSMVLAFLLCRRKSRSQEYLMTNNQKKVSELIYQRTTMRLDAQSSFASSADQRSLVFATLSIAAGALVFSALENSTSNQPAAISAFFFSLAAAFSSLAAVPQKFFTAGSSASELSDLANQDFDFHEILLGLAHNNDQYIDHNELGARLRGHIYRLSIVFFLFGISASLWGYVTFETLEVTTK